MRREVENPASPGQVRFLRRAMLKVLRAALLGAVLAGAGCDTGNTTGGGNGVVAEEAASAEGVPAPQTPADDAPQPQLPEPDVRVEAVTEVAPGITVVPDPRVDFVPNVGIVEGSEAVLIVDTGLGEANGRRVLDLAREIAGDRRLYLTTTHFHPEHNFGASAFTDHAIVLLNERQAVELREKGQKYIELFKTFGPQVAERLEGTTLVEPDQTYSDTMTLDLGDREVVFREMPAHTRGDQLIHVPDAGLIFTGDLAETRYFPIMPDADSSGERWIAVLRDLEALEPGIVVPGHGAVGGLEILTALRVHIEFMRERVEALAAESESQQAITDLLVPAVAKAYPHWGNEGFLPFEIAILYAEATGNPPDLPGF